ncbi:MAG: peptidoglycan editing factor PgeF [Formosimonas sp.]
MNPIVPDWAAPSHVHAFMTTRTGGVSVGAYGPAGLNPASHVGDNPQHVQHNRALMAQHVPSAPLWLEQTHSVKVWLQTANEYDHAAPPPEADAVVLSCAGQVGVVMTADCLPVLFASGDGQIIGAAHAGWRGLVDGVLEQTLSVMAAQGADVTQIHAWLGAAIGPARFEVGGEVLAEFAAKTAADVAPFFVPHANGKYWADIYGLARQRLNACGVTRITGGTHCTVSEAERFYSYRRDKVTGRMATLIWRD